MRSLAWLLGGPFVLSGCPPRTRAPIPDDDNLLDTGDDAQRDQYEVRVR